MGGEMDIHEISNQLQAVGVKPFDENSIYQGTTTTGYYQPLYPPRNPSPVCPGCGRCPYCGRHAQPPYPIHYEMWC